LTDTREYLKYWVGFSKIPGIGRVKLARLETQFGSIENAWEAPVSVLRNIGIDSKTLKYIDSYRPKIDLDYEITKMKKFGVRAITYHDKEYPSRLKQIYDYPPVLYIKGSFTPEDEYSLTVVGTRRASAYGRQVTDELVTELARSKITIISGLARGIDSIAHRSALEAGGRSIAVFACGLDYIYPLENAGLAEEIVKKGAIISEHPLGVKPRPEHFPRRNRILSGLGLGVLVVEASSKSGALITANLALEQNREVFAVPGSILSQTSRGTNNLIKEGAKLVSDCSDILEELNITALAKQVELKEVIPASDKESLILKKLGAEPVYIDEICHASGLPMSQVSSTLAMMEIKGLVKQVGSMNYILAREARERYRVEID